mgnify:CR=1 FL=1|tara:strand:+ start:3871 stop:4224 length:354 start_codon:yes stop_codon:yes gene_type:complete
MADDAISVIGWVSSLPNVGEDNYTYKGYRSLIHNMKHQPKIFNISDSPHTPLDSESHHHIINNILKIARKYPPTVKEILYATKLFMDNPFCDADDILKKLRQSYENSEKIIRSQSDE